MSSEAPVENGALGSMMHTESLVERTMENVYYLLEITQFIQVLTVFDMIYVFSTS
jgi:hypothetical protein